jgi:serine/threonine-protein kinase
MAVVYAAVHPVIGKRAALKVIRPSLAHHDETVERFVQEAKIVNLIAHPDVVDIFQIGRHSDGRVYLVMELLAGRTLAARCEDDVIPTAEAIALLGAICRPLAWAHAHGVVHRDLKPDNVFLADVPGGPRIKLLDWGLSAQMSAEEHCVAAEAKLIGTPRYIAPEQARGVRVDERADIYALGVTAYELLLGRAPFEGDEMSDLVRCHVNEAPPPPRSLWRSIPAELDELLTAMLAKAPRDRPPLASVHQRLARIGARRPRSRQPTAPPDRPSDQLETLDMAGRSIAAG